MLRTGHARARARPTQQQFIGSGYNSTEIKTLKFQANRICQVYGTLPYSAFTLVRYIQRTMCSNADQLWSNRDRNNQQPSNTQTLNV